MPASTLIGKGKSSQGKSVEPPKKEKKEHKKEKKKEKQQEKKQKKQEKHKGEHEHKHHHAKQHPHDGKAGQPDKKQKRSEVR